MGFRAGTIKRTTASGIPLLYGGDDGSGVELIGHLRDSDLNLGYNLTNNNGFGEAVAISRGVVYAGMADYGNTSETDTGGGISIWRHSRDSDGNGNGYLLPKFTHKETWEAAAAQSWSDGADNGGVIEAGYGKVVTSSRKYRQLDYGAGVYQQVNLWDEYGNPTLLAEYDPTSLNNAMDVAIGDKRVGLTYRTGISTSNEQVKLFDLDGNLQWEINTRDLANHPVAEAGVYPFANRIAIGCGLVVLGHQGANWTVNPADYNENCGVITALDIRDGSVKWVVEGSDPFNDVSSGSTVNEVSLGYDVAVGCGMVVATAPEKDFYGAIYAYDLEGNRLWTRQSEVQSTSDSRYQSGADLGFCVKIGFGRIYVSYLDYSRTGGGPTSVDPGHVEVYDLDGNFIEFIDNETSNSKNFGTTIDVAPGLVAIGYERYTSPWSGQDPKVSLYKAPMIFTPWDVKNVEEGYK